MTQVIEAPVFKQANDQIVFQAMTRLLCADRDTLTHHTGLARTTVFDALTRLEREQAVVPFYQNNVHQGRPKTIFVLNPQYGQLTTHEWRRLQTSIVRLYQFFSELPDEHWLFCSHQGGLVRYGEIKNYCLHQCGVRIGCMEANQEAGK